MKPPIFDPPAVSTSSNGFSVVGGVGGTTFGFQELERAACALDAVVGALTQARGELQGVYADFIHYAQAMVPYPGAAVDELAGTVTAVAHSMETLASLSSKVRAAKHNYDQVEGTVAALIQGDDAWRSWLDGVTLSGALLIGAANWARHPADSAMNDPVMAAILELTAERVGSRPGHMGLRDNAQILVAQLPPTLFAAATGYSAAGWAPGRHIGGALERRGIPSASAASKILLQLATGAHLFTNSPLTVQEVQPERTGTTGQNATGQRVLAPNLHSMYSGVQDAYTVADSAVVVTKVEKPDGLVTFVVDIPGTEDWQTPDSESLFDMEGNLTGMAAAQLAQVKELVATALARAGARTTDAVILNSHSGGGINAAAMVADPDFMKLFNVQMLNVAGAPMGYFPIPSKVSVLALENVDDAVAGLDGVPNPDAVNLVTVTTGQRPGADHLDVVPRVMNAHAIDAYSHDALVLDSSKNPSVAAHTQKLRELLGSSTDAGIALAAGTTVSVHVFQGRDAPVTAKSTLTPTGQVSKSTSPPSQSAGQDPAKKSVPH